MSYKLGYSAEFSIPLADGYARVTVLRSGDRDKRLGQVISDALADISKATLESIIDLEGADYEVVRAEREASK